MKTRYKILIVIAVTLFIFVGTHLVMYSCNDTYECGIFYNLYTHIGISQIGTMCSEEDLVNNPECVQEIIGYSFTNDLAFILFFLVIPSLVIIAIWYKDRQ